MGAAEEVRRDGTARDTRWSTQQHVRQACVHGDERACTATYAARTDRNVVIGVISIGVEGGEGQHVAHADGDGHGELCRSAGGDEGNCAAQDELA